MCNTAPMTAARDSRSEVDQFVAENTEKRLAQGLSAHITDGGVYRVLDGIMVGRDATTASADTKADRRRRAVTRSRNRVPYQ